MLFYITPIIAIILLSMLFSFLATTKYYFIYPVLICPLIGIVLSEIYFEKLISAIIFFILIIIQIVYYLNSSFRGNSTHSWYDHETKSGKADARYKKNRYHEYTEEKYSKEQLEEHSKKTKMSSYSILVCLFLIFITICSSR